MIHPSYFELMDVVNRDVPEGEEPIVTSRYSIVLGTAKRARQIVAAGYTTYNGEKRNALSIAVDELNTGKIHIVRPGSETADEIAADDEDWEEAYIEEGSADEPDDE